jgi:hypothetical protein
VNLRDLNKSESAVLDAAVRLQSTNPAAIVSATGFKYGSVSGILAKLRKKKELPRTIETSEGKVRLV